MAIFRISFDTTGSYVIYNPVRNNLIWENINEITPAITRVKLSGDITFIGSEYTTLKNYKDAGNNYVDTKIEQFDVTWQTIFEGNADLLSKWDENVKSITLSKFNNDDYYDNLISNYDIKYSLNELSLTNHTLVTPSITTITRDAVLVAGTGLTPANYITTYDINGFNYSLDQDPRWAYFLYRSTNGDGSHNFETMAFDFDVNTSSFVPIQMLILSENFFGYKWVKLPGSVGATTSITNVASSFMYRFPSILNTLVPIANTSLTFTESTAVTYTGQSDSTPTQYSWFDYTKYLLGETSEIASIDTKESVISLKDLFDIMENAFNLFWYIDGTALKFKHASELTSSGTLDLSTITANLKRLDYFIPEIPDLETFETLDYEGITMDTSTSSNPYGKLQIYYKSTNNILSNNIKLESKINISTNLVAILAGTTNIDKNNFALIESTNDTSTPRIAYGTYPYLNSRLSTKSLFGHLNKWRFGDDANLATRLKFAWIPITEIESRPLTKIPITNYHIDLLTDYDMDKAITTSAGTGKTKRISQRLDSDKLELEIEL